MTTISYGEVLKAAHQLPPAAQADLAAALLRNLKPRSRQKKRYEIQSTWSPCVA